MTRKIIVIEATGISVDEMPVEMVERKGIGHPDSLCDGIAERVSVEYTRWCKENLDKQLHHNFDKVQLVAGEAFVDFNQGGIKKTIRIQIAGRAIHSTTDGRKIPVKNIARDNNLRSYTGQSLMAQVKFFRAFSSLCRESSNMPFRKSYCHFFIFIKDTSVLHVWQIKIRFFLDLGLNLLVYFHKS